MNISFSIMRILFCASFCTQLAFGMKKNQSVLSFSFFSRAPSFTIFSQLEPEIQSVAMQQSDNYANLQQTNKRWYKEISLKSETMITNVFSYLATQRKVDIFLNAVYVKNYSGVKNILKDNKFLMSTAGRLYHYIDTNDDGKMVVLDAISIAECNADKEMLELLHIHNVPKFAGPTIYQYQPCQPTQLMMTCLAGNSKDIVWYLNEPIANMKNAFAIAIDCDRGKCLNILIDDLHLDSDIADIMQHMKQIQVLLKKSGLKRACETKKIKALKELLASKHFCLNEVENGKTILDEILELAKIDGKYNEVAVLLQGYGAKTAKKLATDADDEEDVVRKLGCPGCVII